MKISPPINDTTTSNSDDAIISYDSHFIIQQIIANASINALKQSKNEHYLRNSHAIDEICNNNVPEIPKNKDHGDFATNLAMLLAKPLKTSPQSIALLILSEILKSTIVLSGDIAGPGFINIQLTPSFWQQILANFNAHKINKLSSISSLTNEQQIHQTQYSHGGKKINLEFVSANPTGPMHLGHARGAVYGDVLANLLTYFGNDVTREYYINDAGEQTKNLMKSLWIRYLQLLGDDSAVIDEHCYPGQYLVESAQRLYRQYGTSLKDIPISQREERIYNFAIKDMMHMIKDDLHNLGVHHDVFVSEKHDIIANGRVEEAIDSLNEKHLIYEGYLSKPLGYDDKDWQKTKQTIFKSTQFGDDEDRVLIKANGTYTYLAPDIAYHHYKHERGFTDMILLLGADHSGYVKRLQATVAAVSDNNANVNVLLMQMVKLSQNGEIVKMSKRAGNFITLHEVLEELGKDILRFLMLWKKYDSSFEIDVNKAKEQSKDNPVFYVQYAHTRAVSVLDKARANEILSHDELIIEQLHNNRVQYLYELQPDADASSELSESSNVNSSADTSAESSSSSSASSSSKQHDFSAYRKSAIDYTKLTTPSEINLMQKISMFEHTLKGAANTMELHRISYYLYELATEFNQIWNQSERFISEDIPLSRARLAMVYGLAKTIGTGLQLMGITPLLKM